MSNDRFYLCLLIVVALLSNTQQQLNAQYSSKAPTSLRNLGGYSSKMLGSSSKYYPTRDSYRGSSRYGNDFYRGYRDRYYRYGDHRYGDYRFGNRHYSSFYGRPYYGHNRYYSSHITFGFGGLNFGYGYPLVGSYYPYNFPYYYGFPGTPYGTYYRPGDNYVEYYLPPTHQPAELNYGPQAVKQFLGLGRNFAQQPQLTGNVGQIANAGPLSNEYLEQLLNKPIPLDDSTATENLPPPSSAQDRERAEKFIQYGDQLFQQQRAQEALGRYKTAESNAPDVADVHFRKGFAYLATNRFDHALSSFQRGLLLDANYPESKFNLSQLYQANSLARVSLLETLAKRALADPKNPETMFLVGIVLHFDGQQPTAEKYFQRAAKLMRNPDPHWITAFLPDSNNQQQPVNTQQPAAPIVNSPIGYDL